MKLKKIICGILFAAVMLALSACTSDDSSKADSSSKSTKASETTSSQTSEEDSRSSDDDSKAVDAKETSESAEFKEKSSGEKVMETPQLELIGHSSVKIKMTDGRVIYIDPAYNKIKDAYEEPADVILITHQHGDHNVISLVKQNDDCTVITNKEALVDKEYKTFDLDGLKIESVAAENSNHNISMCVGYVLTFDGITVYHAGDTSTVQELTDTLSKKTIDYALYPIDGEYNMDAAEATKFADSIGAKNNIPIHINDVSSKYNEEKAKTFTPQGALYIPYGETIDLK